MLFEHLFFSHTIDLRGLTAELGLHFDGCVIKRLDLDDASLMGVRLSRCRVDRVQGVRLRLAGNFSTRAIGSTGWNERTTVRHLELSGAEIGGNLELQNADFPGWTEKDSNLRLGVKADGIRVSGNLYLGSGTVSKGELRFNGCVVNRNVDASDCRISNFHGYALSLAGATVKGNLRCHREGNPGLSPGRLRCHGCLRISGARIEGDLDLSEATCIAPMRWTDDHYDTAFFGVEAQGANVGGDVRLRAFRGFGAVDMTNVTINGDLDAPDACFYLTGLHALILEGAHVKGGAWLAGSRTDGVLRLVHATFESRLMLRGLTLVSRGKRVRSHSETPSRDPRSGTRSDLLPQSLRPSRLGGNACGVNLNRATVNGVFELGLTSYGNAPGSPRARRWVSLAGFVAREFDDREAWGTTAWDRSSVDRIDFAGFRFAG